MINKEKLKDSILLAREFSGMLTFMYVPKKTIFSAKKLYELYYSGQNKIEIGSYYNNNAGEFIEISDSNLDEIIDKIYKILNDNIGPYIMTALDNLELDDCYLKYFDNEPELFKKFKKEILRLKKSNDNK